eukprot:GHVP01011058.1.p1 GENE.GHVP01011058.1~~GHVP01011058.1.p1  ORF type:complete len:205 (-),score=14.33 GHVP01011058.1:70-684(-)
MVLLARITNIIIMLYCQWARGTRLRYSASSCKQKSLEPITETHPDCLAIYQDDVAIAASTIEKTMEIAKLVKQQMALAGLKCNEEKTHWNPTDTKPLLGAMVASPNYTEGRVNYSIAKVAPEMDGYPTTKGSSKVSRKASFLRELSRCCVSYCCKREKPRSRRKNYPAAKINRYEQAGCLEECAKWTTLRRCFGLGSRCFIGNQ